MNFSVTHRLAFIGGLLLIAVSLLLHDWNLYPNLRPYRVPVLSLLRLLLLAVPFVLGWMLACWSSRLSWVQKGLGWFLWLFFLPYTIYSVTEIRHVAELCRLAHDTYTSACVDNLWTLYPTLVYALAGTLLFVFSLSQVTAKLIPESATKRFFILTACLYTSAASVFGLYTRLNIWDAFTNPWRFLDTIGTVLTKPAFSINVLVYFLFTSTVFFVLNRTLYLAHKYIFEKA